jgi:hypothetical protein
MQTQCVFCKLGTECLHEPEASQSCEHLTPATEEHSSLYRTDRLEQAW